MSELLNKALINYKSADVLKKNYTFYSSSIHCSYYSCLQVVLHLITNTELKTEWEKFKADANKKEEKKEDEKGLHNLYISFLLQNLFKSKDGYDVASEFGQKINSLKAARTASDYEEKVIKSTWADDSFERAKKVRELLYKHYEI